MKTDERIDLPDSAWRAEALRRLLDYPIGADSISTVGRRYPVEITTLRQHTFPFLVIFDHAVIAEARRCCADGARVHLYMEAKNGGRTRYVTKIERV